MGIFDWLSGKKQESPRPTPPKSEHLITLNEDTNLTPDLRVKIGEALTDAVNSGKKIDRSLMDNIPDYFEWRAYDKWYSIFKDVKQWPILWSDAENHNRFTVNYPKTPLRDVASNATKEDLLNLASAHGLTISLKKSAKKQELIEAFLSAAVGKEAFIKNDLFERLSAWHQKNALLEKKGLFLHSMEAQITIKKNLRQYGKSSVVKAVEWLADDDSCDFCKKLKGKKYPLDKAPIPGVDTHPGCRCDILPVTD